ncbi:hypothetical protein PP182_02250 [Maribacter sp. PR1]|uniref:Uncharacterized protein n=1 Tax=Maribacter cobaltidurans TaxID=1178778 RepID=A0ABU7IPI4_9FLAO|nr:MULTISPECIES: hypothetical protein [Maribacter]MDC6387487.1 hypothetical protein [Maribacter sp. PR1]MEE1974874.1 hypothetical protein [Maribacter cobaltidurans]
MKINRTYTNKSVIRTGGVFMCMFYLLGIFNGLVLETFHEVSHILAPKTHSHSYAFGHEIVNYGSLKGMAGHSHNALKELKELLEANKKDKEEPKSTPDFKIDKHISEELVVKNMYSFPIDEKTRWNYHLMSFFWYPNINTPPPKCV